MNDIDPVSEAIGSLTSGQKHLGDSFERLRVDMGARSDLIHGRLDEMMGEIRTKIHDDKNKTHALITALGNDMNKIAGRVASLEDTQTKKQTNKKWATTLWIGSGAFLVAIIEHWNDLFGRH